LEAVRIDPETRTYIHVVKGRASEFARRETRFVPKLTGRELAPLKVRAVLK